MTKSDILTLALLAPVLAALLYWVFVVVPRRTMYNELFNEVVTPIRDQFIRSHRRSFDPAPFDQLRVQTWNDMINHVATISLRVDPENDYPGCKQWAGYTNAVLQQHFNAEWFDKNENVNLLNMADMTFQVFQEVIIAFAIRADREGVKYLQSPRGLAELFELARHQNDN